MRYFTLASVLTCALMLTTPMEAAIVVDFEDLTLFTGNNPAGGGQFYNGNDGSNQTNSNGWSSSGVFFNNNYNSSFGGFWNGWAYSNVSNPTTPGFQNQYAAFPGSGADGSRQYAIAFGNNAFFNIPENYLLNSVSISNTTYTALAMRDGDAFSKKFGGISGNDPDFFRVSLRGFTGLGGTGTELGSLTVTLADFTFNDNSLDFIISEWLNIDLSPIANSRSVSLQFASSDVGQFGINTPTYIALDNLRLTAVPEPSSIAALAISTLAIAFYRRRRKVLP